MYIISREKGIRTLDMLPYTRFPSVRLQPLGHLSNYFCKVMYFLSIIQRFIPFHRVMVFQK